ncbi:MAG: 1-acyl-sn-glycerol-3-phosphate acyltransferase [Spirochaetes bacterium]|nr:1-acyl-sn-glycerol-3-phosphate acyltransferase [Spirochaetota bacterium]
MLILKPFHFIFSIILWIIWWILAVITIITISFISLFTSVDFHNKMVRITCTILTYCVFIFPRLRGIPENEVPFPAIYVGNHVSFFDLFISGMILPGNPRGYEMHQHFNYPIYGWFLKQFGQIPVEKNNRTSVIRSLKTGIDILNNQIRSILIMPEGERTRDGSLLKFNNGAFYLSRKTSVPIVPVVFKKLYEKSSRFTYLLRPGFCDVILLKPIYPEHYKNENEMKSVVYDAINHELHN